MEEAISQLQDLGVTRERAKRALAKFNNDVALAADYVFSYAESSEEEEIEREEKRIVESDEQLARRINLEEQQNAAQSIESASKEATLPSEATSQNAIVHLDKKESFINCKTYDASKWGIVPFDSKKTTTTKATSNEASLTWWTDPEDPSDRLASERIPIGLRPPSYNFAYSPTIVQALFHITAFQHAVLSFRPLPYAWGTPKEYWKGFGEPVPNYRMHQSHTQNQQQQQQQQQHHQQQQGQPSEAQLISLDSPEEIKMAQLTLDSIEETVPVQPQEPEESELEVLPVSMQALAELQRLFAFLGNTKRSYGNVSHFVRALNAKEQQTLSHWGSNEKSFEAFLDMLILCLVEVDEQSEKAVEMDYKPIFRNMFVLKAHIEDGDDYEEEEVYSVSIGVGPGMNSFHECLDPLIFDTYGSQGNQAHTKFTTFKQIPPLLWVILENRMGSVTSRVDYKVDKTIYMDRYMQENKEKALRGFTQMDVYTKQIAQLNQELQRLQQNHQGISKLDILSQATAYFEQEQTADSGRLTEVLDYVQSSMKSTLEKLESEIDELKQASRSLFSTDETMKQRPYDLRATFHHDGKSGTGHYWAYVYVEPTEISLLEDIPAQDGGWFKFCDASVMPVSEQAIWEDTVQPFSMLYADRSIRQYTRDQLNACIPETLNDFIKADDALLEQEIADFQNPKEELMSIDSLEVSADAEDREIQQPIQAAAAAEEEEGAEKNYMFTGEGFDHLKNKVNEAISLASSLASDDVSFLKKFEAFLARCQNRSALEHLYLLYSSEEGINEQASKDDDELELIWSQYNNYITLGNYMVQALDYFVKQDYANALNSLLTTKRQEALWKTQLMLDQDLISAYPGLDTLTFQNLIKRYGQYSLEQLNELAFTKALNAAYRTRGLEDGLRLAQQAQGIMGPDNIAEDPICQSLSNRWLSFTEQIDELSEHQANILNSLVMTWFDGQSSEEEQQVDLKLSLTLDEPLWQRYQQLREASESIIIKS